MSKTMNELFQAHIDMLYNLSPAFQSDIWNKESDEMDADQWLYSEVHNKYKHMYTGKIFDVETWNMWFPKGKPGADDKEECRHNWESTLLLSNTVYDCSICGVKKEDYEKQRSS